MTNSNQQLGNALNAMQAHLDNILQQLSEPLNRRAVTVARMTPQAVGLGDRRGTDKRGNFGIVELKGLHLDALVRFELWADDSVPAETAATSLHTNILTNRDNLRRNGFLRLALESAPPAELIGNVWRKLAEYRVLFEYHYDDADGAESLIARIPIDLTGEFAESTLISDDMVRWDDEQAQTLKIAGQTGKAFVLSAVSILAFLPSGWDGAGVTISADIDGVVRQKLFTSVRAFLNAFTLATDQVELGGNPYTTGTLTFPNADFTAPIVLSRSTDVFTIQYATTAFDNVAIVYLRALH